MRHDDRFQFRFPIDTEPLAESDAAALTEMVRREVESLLEIIVPTVDGKPVEIDGFAFVSTPEEHFPLRSSARFERLIHESED